MGNRAHISGLGLVLTLSCASLQAANLSDEQKAELHSAEEQILRRIPIGGYVPERAVVEQLGRLGMDQMLVRRACVYLVQREILEYKKERRILHRRL